MTLEAGKIQQNSNPINNGDLSINQPDAFRLKLERMIELAAKNPINKDIQPINIIESKLKEKITIAKKSLMDTTLIGSLHIGLQIDKDNLLDTTVGLEIDRYVGISLLDAQSQIGLDVGIVQGCKLAGHSDKQDMLALAANAALDDEVSIGIKFLSDKDVGMRGSQFLATAGFTRTF